MDEGRLAIFQGKEIRRVLQNGEWWFSVIDIIQVLTEQINDLVARKYWNKLAERLRNEGSEVVTNCHRFKLKAMDGKMRETDCANTEGILRVIQSIPSPKAEPLKRWLARVGYERIQEIENPELAQERMKNLYQDKGYSQDWINKRLRGIAIHQNLTDEWQKRGIKTNQEFAILTAEISRATFGITPSQYKKLKGIKRENLRDHMTDLELIFTMLGERVTTEISEQEQPNTFLKNQNIAKRGGVVAGTARVRAEKELGRSVVTPSNYLKNPEKKKQLSN